MTKVYVAGHTGMVGSAIVRQLQNENVDVLIRTHAELELKDQGKVFRFFKEERPDQVYVAAAHVGGILANNRYPVDFIHTNLMITANIVAAANAFGVEKLLFLGSSCIYPKYAQQPIREEALLTGTLEPTNEPYAIAKIAGIKLCESYRRQFNCDFRSLMPTNLYGFGDNYHPENSHVIPGLLRRFHEAKVNDVPEVVVWGSGNAMREFLFTDDLAEACVHFMNLTEEQYWSNVKEMCSHINIGTGRVTTIRALSTLIAKVVGYKGKIAFDMSKPDGTPCKMLDVSLARSMGWESKTKLEDGLVKTYESYMRNIK